MIPSNAALAMAELSSDAVFSRIPPEKYAYYIEAALAAGKQAAAQHAHESVEALCQSLGVTLVIEPKSKRYGTVSLRAQAVTEKNQTTIYVYEESIAGLVENSQWEGVDSLSVQTAIDTHICHELFHVLEEKSSAYVSDLLDCVHTWKLLSWSGKSHVMRCSEIAAHSFAKEMLGLPWLPNLYDYIYLYNQKQLSEAQFTDFFTRMQSFVDKGRGSSHEGSSI